MKMHAHAFNIHIICGYSFNKSCKQYFYNIISLDFFLLLREMQHRQKMIEKGWYYYTMTHCCLGTLLFHPVWPAEAVKIVDSVLNNSSAVSCVVFCCFPASQPEPGFLNIFLPSSDLAATFLGHLQQVFVLFFYKSSLLRP